MGKLLDFIESDRIKKGTKIEMIAQSDWIHIEYNNGKEVWKIKEPYIAYLEEDLILSLNKYPERESKFSRMKWSCKDKFYISEKIIEVYRMNDSDIFVVDTGNIQYYFNVKTPSMLLELEEKGWFD